MPSEKCAARRASVEDGRRMITACCARAPQRCTSRTYMHFHLMFQEVRPISKTRNQLYAKTYALQVVQGRLFGMGQSKANQWIHVLLPALLAALRTLGAAPARSLTALAQRLGVSEADAATVVTPLEEAPAPLATAPAAAPASPLVPMTGP